MDLTELEREELTRKVIRGHQLELHTDTWGDMRQACRCREGAARSTSTHLELGEGLRRRGRWGSAQEGKAEVFPEPKQQVSPLDPQTPSIEANK